MQDVFLDKSRNVRIRARINEASVPRTFAFFNDGDPRTPHDITSYDFELIVFKRSNSLVKLFTLTIGAGLTVQGTDDNELLVEVTAEQATQRADTYFWRLRSAADDNTWLNGAWEFHQGESDAIVEEDEVHIYQ
jgi:hypothetical protein